MWGGSECALPWFSDPQEVRSSGTPSDPEIVLNVSPPEAVEIITNYPEKIYTLAAWGLSTSTREGGLKLYEANWTTCISPRTRGEN